MRVLLTIRKRRDERGAVAIMMALFTVGLCVCAAFVVDFGQAYVNKRQAQVAADSAVLAASKVYATQQGDCATLVGNPALRTQAQTAAETLREQNLPGSRGVGFAVTCNANHELEVSYDVEFDSKVGLGQLATNSDHITVARAATATFDRPVRGQSGMRPWAVCSNSVDMTVSKIVRQVIAGNTDGGTCGSMDISGTWERFACPGFEKGDGSDKDDKPTSTLYWIRNGCPNPASPIPTDATDPAQLWSDLVNYCGTLGKNDESTEFCLTRDTGNARNDKMTDAWQSVIDAGLTIEMPVYCAYPTCSSDAITDAPAVPIYKLAVVRMCGFNLHGDNAGERSLSTRWPTTGPCATANPDNWKPDSPTTPTDKAAFYLVLEGMIGSTDGSDNGSSSNLRLTQ